MIIITGMDNSGKTTLANTLSQEMGMPVVKSIGPNATRSEQDVWLLDQLIREKNLPGTIIYDRFLPFEEMVYGNILRGESHYTLGDYYLTQLRELKPAIIYTRPSSDIIFNFGDREQMPGVIDQKEKLLRAWDDLMWNLQARGWDVTVFDYTTGEVRL